MGLLVDRESLLALRHLWRQRGEKVVFTNGCFDLLHPGHVRLLEQARSLGDRLVVAINSDAGVQRLKGPQRPILPESERAALIASLAAVDAVTIFDEETPKELLAALEPDILVKGSDWAHWIAGREEVEAAGGRVMAIPVEPDFSTTDIVRRILELNR
jgi:D-beta-D-heptose 7-phosphate kinase/D-beta-D-heptose 1-phosphate adenosyltransferase